ncbi:MAG: glutathione S-transferase family protein [Maricaulaceae bacterium]
MADIILYHHPMTRSGTVRWILEELGAPYTLVDVPVREGASQTEAFKKLNVMGKIPVIKDGEVVVSEMSAIALYLADRFPEAGLTPALNDPGRGPFMTWIVRCTAGIEPAMMQKMAGFEANPGSTGWGSYEQMVDAVETTLTPGPYLLGERVSLADVVLGATLSLALYFKLWEPRPVFADYTARMRARPAFARSREEA